MIQQLKEFVLSNPSIFPGLKSKSTWDIFILVITSEWKKETGKSTYLIFDKQTDFPDYVTSMMLDSKNSNHLENEFNTLSFIRSRVANRIKHQIPQPIYLGPIFSTPCFVQSAISGSPLKAGIYKKNKSYLKKTITALFEDLTGWLIIFEDSLDQDQDEYEASMRELLENELDEFIRTCREDSFLTDEIDLLKDQLSHVENQLPKPKAQHGDFWIGNVIGQDSQIKGIIDWEGFDKATLPFLDLVSLTAHCGFWIGKSWSKNHLLNAFSMQFHTNWYSDLVSGLYRKYLDHHHMDSSLLEIFVPCALVKRANVLGEIIAKNSMPIQNTWKELAEYYFRHKDKYLPLQTIHNSDVSMSINVEREIYS